MNVWEELDPIRNRVRLTPDAKALADAHLKREWTYKELDERITAAAHWLYAKGVRKGDRVALLSPNGISYFDLLFACGRLGAIFVPLNWRLSPAEMNYILEDCTPKLIGYHNKLKNKVEEIRLDTTQSFCIDQEEHLTAVTRTYQREPLEENDPLTIIYTGGTTGRPKGVVLSHRSIIWNAINTIVSWNLTNEDITLTYLPLFHTGGLNALSIPILMAGGKVVLPGDFHPEEAVLYLNEFQCTTVLLVPTMYQMMLETEEFKRSTFPSIKVFLSGGAPCPLGIYEAFQKKRLKFKEGYGLTEAGPNNFYIAPDVAMLKKGSVGKPMLFNEVRLVKEDGMDAEVHEAGELLIKGKHTFHYYWNNAEATQEALEDGWLRTGDLGKRDEDGYYYIVGRKKDMIISGGENVYPLEIEHWLSSHPAIAQAAVTGLPDEKWGEKVVAFIAKNDNDSIDKDELKSYCARKLANYKIPKEFIFIDELPKTHVGKIDKKELKKIGTTRKSKETGKQGQST